MISDALPPPVRDRLTGYTLAFDEVRPGALVGLHVVGSAVLDDYREGRSDIDVLAELATPVEPDVLRAVHRDHRVDAVYVGAGELARPPHDVADGPFTVDGELHVGQRSFELNPVVWSVLARHGVTLRGNPDVGIDDLGAARDFCRANLHEYWLPLLSQVADSDSLGQRTIEWIMLGPVRLWHTVRTGEVVSKTAAGQLAADRWPDLADSLGDAIASRAGSTVELGRAHALAAVDLGHRIARHLRLMVA